MCNTVVPRKFAPINYTPLDFSSLAGISRSVFLAAAYIMTVSPLSSVEALRSVILSAVYTVKKIIVFPVPSRDVAHQTLPSRELLNYSLPGRVWLG